MAYPYEDNEIAIEPLQAKVAADVGTKKAWKIIFSDPSGNALYAESLSWEIRWDPDTLTDGQAVYVGYAKAGTATATAAWLVHKFTFQVVSGFNMPVRRQVQTDIAWDSRAIGW